jgi:hypothetical protein
MDQPKWKPSLRWTGLDRKTVLDGLDYPMDKKTGWVRVAPTPRQREREKERERER